MEYISPRPLNIDEQFILTEQVLPTAKSWVMQYGPDTNMHKLGLQTLEAYQARDAEVTRRLSQIAAADRERMDEIEQRREYFRQERDDSEKQA